MTKEYLRKKICPIWYTEISYHYIYEVRVKEHTANKENNCEINTFSIVKVIQMNLTS